MTWAPWVHEHLHRLEAPSAWSTARTRAEAQWAEIWRGRTGFAIVGRDRRVVAVERRRRHFANGARPIANLEAA